MDILQGKWRPQTLIICNLAAVAILASWLWEPTRGVWDALDAGLFYALNGSLTMGPVWRAGWAVANWRPFDLVAGGMLLFFTIRWFREAGRGELETRMAAFAMFVVVVLATKISFQLILKALDYNRISASGVLEGAIRLQNEIPWMHTKDYSGHSFPADHAFVLIAATVFFWVMQGKKTGLRYGLMFAPFYIPRLVSGGHWLTDITIGSAIMALAALSWWFATPAHAAATRWAGRALAKPLAWGAGIMARFNIV